MAQDPHPTDPPHYRNDVDEILPNDATLDGVAAAAALDAENVEKNTITERGGVILRSLLFPPTVSYIP